MSDWVTVKQAAAILGITEDAVRKRAKRGALEQTKTNNILHVLIEQDKTEQERTAPTSAAAEALLRAQVEELREQNRRLWDQVQTQNRQLEILGQTMARAEANLERVLSLPANAGPSAGGPDHAEPHTEHAATEPKRRGWLDRLLGRQ